MSIIPPGKVLVKAGKFKGGKLPIVSYVGQIKPADMPAILWWGDFGNDGTGTGSISAPFLTFPAALAAFSTTTHKWILKTDLTVYGESEPAAYIDDPADRVYLDPTRPNDSGSGLTAALAKKTYAAAKTVLGSSGRSAIHCIGSFTLTDLIDVRLQGEVGATLTYDRDASMFADSATYINNITFNRSLRTATGRLLVIGYLTAGASTELLSSTNNGQTFTSIGAAPWGAGTQPRDIVQNDSGVLLIVGNAASKQILRSINDGVTWSTVNVAGGGGTFGFACAIWTGTLFVIAGLDNTGARIIYTSPTGLTWTARTAAAAVATTNFHTMATDGAGNVMLVGRTNATTAYMGFSTDHGVTWTNYSALVGVGANTGGVICIGALFKNGRWWIIQDTISPAVWYSDTPTVGAWLNFGTSLMIPNSLGTMQAYKFTWSDRLGGILYLPTSQLDANAYLINNSGVSIVSASVNTEYHNTSILVYNVNGAEYALLSGREGVPPNRGFVKRIALDGANIMARVANVKMAATRPSAIASSVTAANVTAQPSAGLALKSLAGAMFVRSRGESADDIGWLHYGDIGKVRRCLIKAPTNALQINGVAAATGDVEVSQCLIAGNVLLNNTGGTDKELIQDNIIEGNFTAAALVTVKSNIRGALVNTSALSKISTINPLFVDTTDYMLSRVALGQAFDSPLVDRSTIFSYIYNAITYKDDLGPYRAFVALVETTYKRAFLLPKFSGNALSEDIENSASLLKSINGVPDVANRPSARLEIIAWASKTVDGQVREFITFMEKERNTACALFYDFDETILDDIVVNGAHPSGTFEVNIVPKDIPVGTVMSVSGLIRSVIQRYPRSGQAAKLVLDEVLTGGLANGQLIAVEQVQGAGEFIFVPEKRRQNTRVFSRRRDTYSGMRYQFVRKAM